MDGQISPQQQQFQTQTANSQMNGQISSQQQLNQTPTTTTQVAGQISSQHQPCQSSSVEEYALYKNRLQQFTQKASLPLPSYRTVNEQDIRQTPKFRCTVEVDGVKYTSLNTFSTRKAAEKDAAKLALETISEKIKIGASKKTMDTGFPPIHQDRVFCKSILHEFAVKKNVEKPTYNTVKLESVVPLFVSSLIFDGVKYTGEPGVHKKEAEQLAARAVILSILASSGVETGLPEIVKSKTKLISAVHEQCNPSTTISHLPNSGADAIKETVPNVASEEPQQQSTSKKRRFPEHVTESCSGNGDALSISHQLQSDAPLRQEFRTPDLETLPQSSMLPSCQSLSQPSLHPCSQTPPQPHLMPNVLTPSQTNLPSSCQSSLMPSFQNFPQPTLLPGLKTLYPPSSLPSTQTLPQPSLVLSQPTLPASYQTPSQSSLLPSFQNFPQTTLSSNAQSLSLPSPLSSTQTFPQPSLLPNSHVPSQPTLPSISQTPSQSILLPSSQVLPQPNCLPVTSTTSLEPQTVSSKAAARRRKKKKNKANKMENNEIQMPASIVSPSQVVSCTIAQ